MTFDFPQYRSLNGFNRHYMIIDERTFVEAFQIGDKWQFQTIIAEQYPEILRIQDMLNLKFSYEKAAPEIERLFN